MIKIKSIRFSEAVMSPRHYSSTFLDITKHDIEMCFENGFVTITEKVDGRKICIPMNGNVVFFEPLEETKVAAVKKGTKDGKANQEVA